MSKAKDKKTIAIIPARGGSKRIPHKNTIDFFGSPMISWTIKAAQAVTSIARIVVSTDSEEIASVSEAYGVEVPFLRDQYADDLSPVSVATLRAVEQAEQYWGEKYSTVIQLMPNCPLRTSGDILASIAFYLHCDLGAVISIFRPPFVNAYWAMIQDERTNRLVSVFPDAREQRSQDMNKPYFPTGAIWIGEVDYVRTNESFHGEETGGFELDWHRAIDIDEPDELELAELVAPRVLGARVRKT